MKRKTINHILTFLLLTMLNFKSFGTAQVPDILIYEGDTLYIYSNPLEQHPSIDNLRSNFFGNKQGCSSTACWREYQAEWTIENNELWLTNVYSCCFSEDNIKADLQQLFPDKYERGKIKADWVTAEIVSPQGKLLYYVHMGYASLYEKEVVYQIVFGHLKDARIYDNTKSKKSIYSQNTNCLQFVYSNIR